MNTVIVGGSYLKKEEAQANNEKFTSRFGKNLSTSEVKDVIYLIRSNNIIAENDRNGLGKIYILFKQNDGTMIEMSAVAASKAIKTGTRYEINTPNDNKMTEDIFLRNNEYNANDKDLSAAYYYNDFLRVIRISELQESPINTQNTINK